MTDDRSLDDFEGENPNAYEKRPCVYLSGNEKPVRHTDGKIVGYVDRDRARGIAFVTHREAEKHYFGLYDGYAISMNVLAQAQYYEAEYIYIWVKDENRTLVFLLDQYLNGTQVDDEYTPEGEDQRVVTADNARENWDDQHRPDIDIRPTTSNGSS